MSNTGNAAHESLGAMHYEDYPYPDRDPQDEDLRLLAPDIDRLDLISEYVRRGRLDTRDGLRVLVAGGGTGDATIYLGEQLRGTPSTVVHLDPSGSSIEIAQKRAKRRKLTNIQWIQATIDEVSKIDQPPFDYINCSGVLHHLDDPQESLGQLVHSLKPDGALGIMVYAKFGRDAIYRTREALRYLIDQENPLKEKIRITRCFLEGMSEDAPWITEALENDGYLVDMLLHEHDRQPFTVPAVYTLLESVGLKNLLLIHAPHGQIAYEPESYVREQSALRDMLAHLPLPKRQAMAEALSGEMIRHTFLASKNEDGAITVDDPNAVPDFSINLTSSVIAALRDYVRSHERIILPDTAPGRLFSQKIELNKCTKHIPQLIDGSRTIDTITDMAADYSGTDKKHAREISHHFFKRLRALGWLSLRDQSLPRYKRSEAIQGAHIEHNVSPGNSTPPVIDTNDERLTKLVFGV